MQKSRTSWIIFWRYTEIFIVFIGVPLKNDPCESADLEENIKLIDISPYWSFFI